MGQAKGRRKAQQTAFECFRQLASEDAAQSEQAAQWIQDQFAAGLYDAVLDEHAWQNGAYAQAMHHADAKVQDGLRQVMEGVFAGTEGGAVFGLFCRVSLPVAYPVGEFDDYAELETWIAQVLAVPTDQVRARAYGFWPSAQSGLFGPMMALYQLTRRREDASTPDAEELAETQTLISLEARAFEQQGPVDDVQLFLVRVQGMAEPDIAALGAAIHDSALHALPFTLGGRAAVARARPLEAKTAFAAVEHLPHYKAGLALRTSVRQWMDEHGVSDIAQVQVTARFAEGDEDDPRPCLCVAFALQGQDPADDDEYALMQGELPRLLVALPYVANLAVEMGLAVDLEGAGEAASA